MEDVTGELFEPISMVCPESDVKIMIKGILDNVPETVQYGRRNGLRFYQVL